MSRAAAAKTGRVRIGISGWRYAGWRGSFYPKELHQRDELSYASRHFDTIEINGTHYSLQRPEFFARWHDETPDDFVFAIKGSRFITHLKQLREVETPLANFFASGVLRLEEHLGQPLDPARTHVYLCGNPAMIGVPQKDRATGQKVYPTPPGVVEILEKRGFQMDEPQLKKKGNIHFEEYW